MLYFIPAWYKQNMWCENEQQWYMRRLKSEFDETIKQITLFHRNVDRPYRILVLGYSPNFRHFLHRQGMYRSKYWSCFDAIAQVRRKKVAVLSYHDIKWPKGLEFVYSPFSIIALQGDVKYAQVEFGEDGNPISIDMFEDGKICRRNYYDDRGFVSSTVIYENGIEQYQDFLMENGIWKIREYKNDGHVVVNQTCLIRKDFYTYCRTFSEYYAPLDGKAHLYGRTFFNEDGSVCYEEVIEDDSTFYRIGAQVLYTKADLVGYMVKRLNLTADDVVIIDRTTGIGQAILENCGPARVGIVVHADHFSEGGTDDDYILWNNYYEYSFSQTEHIDFYITATDAQNELMRQQFKKYCGKEPQVVTIPVGSLDELKYPDEPRKRHSLITASRLATEKHCDWLVEAVVKAKESVPDISLDIYGKGGDEAKLKGLIGRLDCADYVHLMGQQKLDDVYKHYDAYVAASQSEGFGLTLMEAIGSGLPIVGFDVRYGNQTFIDDGQNGYKIPITDEMDQKEKIKLLSERIVRMFTEDDMDAFSGHSYEKAKEYLTKEVVHRWIELLK